MAKNQVITSFGIALPKQVEFDSPRKTEKHIGLHFPLGSNKSQGGFFSRNGGFQAIRQSIYQLMTTEKGERVMLPDFGVNLNYFVFQPLDEVVFDNIKREITTAFNKYIVGGEILKISVFELGETGPSGGNSLKIVLLFSIKGDENSVQEVEVVIA